MTAITRRAALAAAACVTLVRPALAQCADGNDVNVIDWKIGGGGQYDGIMIGDSNTAILGDFTLTPWPQRPKRVLAAGLPGNGVVNLAYEMTQNNWLSLLKPRFVIIYLGINDCYFANQASWLSPADWANSYQSIAAAAIAAEAVAVCCPYHMPSSAGAGLVSAAQLAAYNNQVRTTVHDNLYYTHPNQFVVVEVAGSLTGSNGLTPDSVLQADGIHWTEETMRRDIKRWLEDGLAATTPF